MMPLRLWLRKRRLQRALQGYPIYDPPHKIEERLLSRERAAENFDYFMRVRLDRCAHLIRWVRQQFGYEVSLDEEGLRSLCRWGNKYAGLLLVEDGDGHLPDSYFTYDPPWVGSNAGNNVIFDFGIVLGEIILSSCPLLRWDLDPISKILPKTGKLLKETSGMSFQRPLISGFNNPAYRVIPLHQSYIFAMNMRVNTTSMQGIRKFREGPRFAQRSILDGPINLFRQTMADYPEGDPSGLLREVGPDEFFKLSDEEANRTEAKDD
ncbi:hypothetical protein [Bradyrhizobium sp. SZCCHNRI3037]|uniref:hypothetical protein n=1 Tax=Bradyrhizobium sp. SZCCHNRI3037 TaxID=3057290 RepID=UPI00291613B0|nr:hypothetical protein [Bradyrhizobium sp. SZCCHNRI3037]